MKIEIVLFFHISFLQRTIPGFKNGLFKLDAKQVSRMKWYFLWVLFESHEAEALELIRIREYMFDPTSVCFRSPAVVYGL